MLSHVSGFVTFTGFVPNMLNVEVDGTPVLGLGHNFNLPAVTNVETEANPFGKDFIAAFLDFGVEEAWQLVCNLDSDGDGRTNGEELCDPDCEFIPAGDDAVDPECLNGAVLTHPGIDNGFPTPAPTGNPTESPTLNDETDTPTSSPSFNPTANPTVTPPALVFFLAPDDNEFAPIATIFVLLGVIVIGTVIGKYMKENREAAK